MSQKVKEIGRGREFREAVERQRNEGEMEIDWKRQRVACQRKREREGKSEKEGEY